MEGKKDRISKIITFNLIKSKLDFTQGKGLHFALYRHIMLNNEGWLVLNRRMCLYH